jgi:predicted phage terminase large subunit-like protein
MMGRQADGADAPPLTLSSWAEQVVAPYDLARHHRLLIAALNDVAEGACDRLMVLMPPGSAKSTYCSIVLPPWWLLRHPTHIIAACHTEALAHHFGRRARAVLSEHGATAGARLARDDRAAGRWRTEAGGEYFAAGVRGPIIGRRADLVLIDDPVKSHAEADSPVLRDALWNWFQSDLIPRLKPKGRIVLVMTRWHEDDLAGRLLAGDDGWRVVRLTALAEIDDPLGRAVGEPLWPEWEDMEALVRKRRAVGERMWAALFQQRPRPDAETMFRVGQIVAVDRTPIVERSVRAWDLAGTEAGHGRDPDWTVGVKLGRVAGGGICVLDVIRLRGGPLAVQRAIRAAAEEDGHSVPIGLPQDPGQAGKHQIAHLTSQVEGWKVVATPETGSKMVRAGPISAQVEAGLFSIVRAPWNATFVDELRDFPHGSKDDQVDALSRAFAMLAQGAPARQTRIDMMAR